MKNPVIAAGVFLLAALGLVAALTLTARTNSGSAETASQTVSSNSSVTSIAADAQLLKLRYFESVRETGIAKKADPTHERIIGILPLMRKDPPW